MAEEERPTFGERAAKGPVAAPPPPAPVSTTKVRSSLGETVAATYEDEARELERQREQKKADDAAVRATARAELEARILAEVGNRTVQIGRLEVTIPPVMAHGEREEVLGVLFQALGCWFRCQQLEAIVIEQPAIPIFGRDLKAEQVYLDRVLGILQRSGYAKVLTT